MEEPRPVGRPTVYTPELRLELCRRLASGRTLRSVCRDEDMPCRETVEDWLIDCDKEETKEKIWILDDFLRHYTRAREVQADNVHDEIVDIADDGTNDYMEIEKKRRDGSAYKMVIFDKEHVQRSKLRVDARLSWLANTAPRKYGKNIKVESQVLGKDGQPTDPPGSAQATDAFLEHIMATMEKGKVPK